MKIAGFSFAAVEAGIRYPNRLDLGLIYSEVPCVAAGVFTTSRVKAAPLHLDIERLKNGGRAQAILVNSGCANACTGAEGMATARESGRLLAEALAINENLVQLASTGVIGEQLNIAAVAEHLPALVAGRAPGNFDRVARAIMTTDTVPKTARAHLDIAGRQVTILGMAKGAGMIMPNMATMLCFIVTDARIDQAELHQALVEAADRSFNRITIDGDTSTNDMVLVMASGAAENQVLNRERPEQLRAFSEALQGLCRDLARQIVADGEGASKTVTIRVSGAETDAAAEQIARTVANSNLVKTAFFGEDANWGRIIAAIGRAGVAFDPERVDIAFDEVVMVKDGLGQGKEVEATATRVLREKSFTVAIDLHQGPGWAEVLTCDFSIDYVKINADYRS
jgi:glutamate N-acetyltransferase/amino-acid N-acetyltransferase